MSVCRFHTSVTTFGAAVLMQYCGALHCRYSSQLTVKPPRGGREVPWHQDGGADCRTLWITLDDVDERVGGLLVRPGMHRHGRLPLRRIDPDARDAIQQYHATVFNAQHHVYGIDTASLAPPQPARSPRRSTPAPVREASRSTPFPELVGSDNRGRAKRGRGQAYAVPMAYQLRGGGAAMHHPLLPHASHRNMSAHRWRRVLVLRYQPAAGRTEFDMMPAWVRHWRTGQPFLKRSYLVSGKAPANACAAGRHAPDCGQRAAAPMAGDRPTPSPAALRCRSRGLGSTPADEELWFREMPPSVTASAGKQQLPDSHDSDSGTCEASDLSTTPSTHPHPQHGRADVRACGSGSARAARSLTPPRHDGRLAAGRAADEDLAAVEYWSSHIDQARPARGVSDAT